MKTRLFFFILIWRMSIKNFRLKIGKIKLNYYHFWLFSIFLRLFTETAGLDPSELPINNVFNRMGIFSRLHNSLSLIFVYQFCMFKVPFGLLGTFGFFFSPSHVIWLTPNIPNFNCSFFRLEVVLHASMPYWVFLFIA